MNAVDSAELDEIDIRILEMLQDNCNLKMTNIAKELSIAESTIRYRIDRMEKKGVITNYIALLNPRKVGLNITAIMLIKITPQYINSVSVELAKFKELRHLFRSTGVYDMISVVNARNIYHLNELMEKIKLVEGINDLVVEVATELIKVDPKFSLR
jgi:DNA-binding Lrp family transcriptional regulator